MRIRELYMFGAATVIVALDQATKYVVTRYLPLGEPWSPIPSLKRILSFTRITNTGVAFGLFPQLGLLFSILPILVVAGILLYYRNLPAHHRLLQVSLGLQLGGALGNLVDRLRVGHVVDFIDFKVWAVFNIADSAIVAGTVLLAYHILFDPALQPQEQESKQSA